MTLPLDVATDLVFTVTGTPAPQGSKSAFQRGKKIILVESSKAVKPWREDVCSAAKDAMLAVGWVPLDGPITVAVTFLLRRPPSIPKRRLFPDRKPDLDKLIRSTLDALTTAGAITDDARAIDLMLRKRYAAIGQAIGASIHVSHNTEAL